MQICLPLKILLFTVMLCYNNGFWRSNNSKNSVSAERMQISRMKSPFLSRTIIFPYLVSVCCYFCYRNSQETFCWRSLEKHRQWLLGSAYMRANKQNVSSCYKLFIGKFTISVVTDVKFNISSGLTKVL